MRWVDAINIAGMAKGAVWLAAGLVILALPAALPVAAPDGGQLIQDLGCPVCHEIRGHDTTIRGEAPDLSKEGDKVRSEWLFAFLKQPFTLRPQLRGRMPDFRLTDEEALALTEYLGTLREAGAPPLDGKFTAGGSPTPEAIKAGQALASKDYLDCWSCHQQGDKKPEGPPEGWAPDLALARARLRPEWIIRWLQDPQKVQPGTKMPTFFSGEGSGPEDILGGDVARQMTAVRDYVLSLGVSASVEAYGRARRAHPEATADLGRSLMVKFNCVGCHNVDRLPDGKRVAPSLAFQGSRVKPEWLVGFLRTPTDIKPEYAILGTGARMPAFRLSEDEVRALADYIMRTLVDPAPSGAAAPPLTAALVERGERLFDEKDCKSCHRIGGANAGGIGPILSAAESRLRPEWVARFIRNPDRFLPKTEMPTLGLTEEDAWALTAYLMSAK